MDDNYFVTILESSETGKISKVEKEHKMNDEYGNILSSIDNIKENNELFDCMNKITILENEKIMHSNSDDHTFSIDNVQVENGEVLDLLLDELIATKHESSHIETEQKFGNAASLSNETQVIKIIALESNKGPETEVNFCSDEFLDSKVEDVVFLADYFVADTKENEEIEDSVSAISELMETFETQKVLVAEVEVNNENGTIGNIDNVEESVENAFSECLKEVNDVGNDAAFASYSLDILTVGQAVLINDCEVEKCVGALKLNFDEETKNQTDILATVENLSNMSSLKKSKICKYQSDREDELEVNFYSNDILRKKGFSLRHFGNSREFSNLHLYGGSSKDDCMVRSRGFACDITKNKLIPLFETIGKVFLLRLIKSNSLIVLVTYMTPDDALKAVESLHNRKFEGRLIEVQKHTPVSRLFVKPIPPTATKQKLFHVFSLCTIGLVNVLLFDSNDNKGCNRGFCFLQFEDHMTAVNAKRDLSKKIFFGKHISVDWPLKQMIEKPGSIATTVYISNLRSNIRASRLRECFSVYGEIKEIDKENAFARVQFQNAGDADRAAREIDTKLLGNENVLVTTSKLSALKSKRSSGKPTKYIIKK